MRTGGRTRRLRRRLVTSAVLPSVLLAAAPASAASAPDDGVATLPCRPTIACTADLVQPGALELESGALFRRLAAGARQWTFPFLLKLTLDVPIQIQVGSNGYSAVRGSPPSQFFDDALVGAKVHLHDQTRATPSVSVSATASVPIPARQQGYVRTLDAFLTGYATKDVGPVHADANVGVNLWRLDGAPLAQGFAALALSMNLPWPFGAMVEAYYFSNAAPIATRDGGLLFALSHSPTPWLIFDFGGDVGWFPAERAYSVFFGMTIVPVVLWRRTPSAHAPIE
jgi:hypothetical protein